MMTSDALVAFLNMRLDEDEAMVAEPHIWPTTFRPERVLREVEAMRAIVRRCEQQAAKEHDNAMEEDRTWTLWPVLFDLAAIYRDHPGYRPEWKP